MGQGIPCKHEAIGLTPSSGRKVTLFELKRMMTRMINEMKDTNTSLKPKRIQTSS
jgi:hypothetical protein